MYPGIQNRHEQMTSASWMNRHSCGGLSCSTDELQDVQIYNEPAERFCYYPLSISAAYTPRKLSNEQVHD